MILDAGKPLFEHERKVKYTPETGNPQGQGNPDPVRRFQKGQNPSCTNITLYIGES